MAGLAGPKSWRTEACALFKYVRYIVLCSNGRLERWHLKPIPRSYSEQLPLQVASTWFVGMSQRFDSASAWENLGTLEAIENRFLFFFLFLFFSILSSHPPSPTRETFNVPTLEG